MTRRTLRAFVWLRWRVLLNSLERTGSRDALERFSIAIEKLGPLIALILLVPSAIALAGIGAVAGFGLATGSWALPFTIVRFFLLASLVFTIIGPIVLPMRDAASAVRFLLLPISRGTLYLAHLSGTLADPWILLVLPALAGIVAGLAIGGDFAGAAGALLAGAALLALLTGLTSLTGSIIHLLLRNRRRADIVMLVLVLGLPVIGFLPSLMQVDRADRHMRAIRGEPAEERNPPAIERAAVRAFGYVPSELYKKTVEGAATRRGSAIPTLLLLAGLAAGVQAAGRGAFARVLDQPQSLGVRRASALGGIWSQRLPGLSAAASAVAMTQARLALRTPRGRSSLASPLLLFVLFGVGFVRRHGAFAGIPMNSGLMLAAFCVFASLLAILPLAANQFAVDGSGFTRYLLAPIPTRDVVFGKAAGNLLVSLVPAVISFALGATVFRGGDPRVWLAIPPGYLATYALVAPVLAAVSAIFPRKVDLSRIGQGSNPHQGASILSLLACAAAAAPPVLLVLMALHWWRQSALAPLLVGGWCVVSLVVASLLFIPVRRLVANRAETLAQYY